jgi:hypothetical protein
VTATVQ